MENSPTKFISMEMGAESRRGIKAAERLLSELESGNQVVQFGSQESADLQQFLSTVLPNREKTNTGATVTGTHNLRKVCKSNEERGEGI